MFTAHLVPLQLAKPRSIHQASCTAAPSCCFLLPPARAGLLSSLTSTFTDLGLDVVRAEIGGKGGTFRDTFWVTTMERTKVSVGWSTRVAGRWCGRSHWHFW